MVSLILETSLLTSLLKHSCIWRYVWRNYFFWELLGSYLCIIDIMPRVCTSVSTLSCYMYAVL